MPDGNTVLDSVEQQNIHVKQSVALGELFQSVIRMMSDRYDLVVTSTPTASSRGMWSTFNPNEYPSAMTDGTQVKMNHYRIAQMFGKSTAFNVDLYRGLIYHEFSHVLFTPLAPTIGLGPFFAMVAEEVERWRIQHAQHAHYEKFRTLAARTRQSIPFLFSIIEESRIERAGAEVWPRMRRSFRTLFLAEMRAGHWAVVNELIRQQRYSNNRYNTPEPRYINTVIDTYLLTCFREYLPLSIRTLVESEMDRVSKLGRIKSGRINTLRKEMDDAMWEYTYTDIDPKDWRPLAASFANVALAVMAFQTALLPDNNSAYSDAHNNRTQNFDHKSKELGAPDPGSYSPSQPQETKQETVQDALDKFGEEASDENTDDFDSEDVDSNAGGKPSDEESDDDADAEQSGGEGASSDGDAEDGDADGGSEGSEGSDGADGGSDGSDAADGESGGSQGMSDGSSDGESGESGDSDSDGGVAQTEEAEDIDDADDSGGKGGQGAGKGAVKARKLEDLAELTLDELDEMHEVIVQSEDYDNLIDAMNAMMKKGVLLPEQAQVMWRPVGLMASNHTAMQFEMSNAAIRPLSDQVEAYWEQRTPTGKLDMMSVMKSRGQRLDVFRRWHDNKEDDTSFEIVVALDHSGSMGQSIFEVTQDAWVIKRLADEFNMPCTVMTYNQVFGYLYKREEKADKARVRHCDAEGGTHAGSVINNAYTILTNSDKKHRIFVMLTDGAWNDQANVATRQILDMRAAGIQCHFVYYAGEVQTPKGQTIEAHLKHTLANLVGNFQSRLRGEFVAQGMALPPDTYWGFSDLHVAVAGSHVIVNVVRQFVRTLMSNAIR